MALLDEGLPQILQIQAHYRDPGFVADRSLWLMLKLGAKVLNNIIEQLEAADKYKIFHPTTAVWIHSPRAHIEAFPG